MAVRAREGDDLESLRRDLDALPGPGDLREGTIPTGVPGLSVFQSATGSACRSVVYRPVISLVVQGRKRVRLGGTSFLCTPGQILVVGFDAVLEAEILEASDSLPFRALCLDLDVDLLQEIAGLIPFPAAPTDDQIEGVFRIEGDKAITSCLERLLGLVRDPRAAPALAPAYQREIAYHLLNGPRGRDVLRLATPHSRTRLLAAAIREIHSDLAHPLRVPRLAASVGMSPSLFHERFKELTSHTPIQYQKRLRLLEARRLMSSQGLQAGEAAFQVGYRSPSQFSREYVRLFGAPPRRDAAISRIAESGSSAIGQTF